MDHDIKLWKLNQCADRANHLALSFAMIAARLGDPAGRSQAVIADELKSISNIIEDIFRKNNFQRADLSEDSFCNDVYLITERLEQLVLNASITALKCEGYKDVLVLSEECRRIAIELKSVIADETPEDYSFEVPVVVNKSVITAKPYYFLSFIIGGQYFVENTEFVQEILFYQGCKKHKLIKDGVLELRGKKMKIINCYDKFELKMPEEEVKMRLIIIKTTINGSSEYLALLVDRINADAIFVSQLGVNTMLKSKNLSAEYVRECWDTDTNKQMIFLNWNKLL